MVVLVGLDLAWSGKNPSGYCVLRVGPDGAVELQALGDCVMSPERAFAWLQSLGADVIAAIDAPLIIGDHRRAEGDMARAHPKTGLYAYSARWDFLSRHRITAGPELGALLDAHGWLLDPKALPPRAAGKWALEVFPHAVTVSLLQAKQLLRYKKGRRDERLRALSQYQGLLTACAQSMLGDVCASGLAGALGADASLFRGEALKSHEDRLDAIACALAAYVAYCEGSVGLRVFGDARDGYIAVPLAQSVAPGSA